MAHLHCEQVVLLKDKKKVFTLEKLDYEPETGAIHPGGTTAAVGGAVSVDFGVVKLDPAVTTMRIPIPVCLLALPRTARCVCTPSRATV